MIAIKGKPHYTVVDAAEEFGVSSKLSTFGFKKK